LRHGPTNLNFNYFAVIYVFVCGDLFHIHDFGILYFEDEQSTKEDTGDDWFDAALVLSDDPTARKDWKNLCEFPPPMVFSGFITDLKA
jgi:hypothetical protein